MRFYAMAFLGMFLLGSLLAGTHYLGAPATTILGGLCCIAGSLNFARQLPPLRVHVHPIYVEKGIIPEVAEGLASATRNAP